MKSTVDSRQSTVTLRVNGEAREVPERTGVAELVALVTGRAQPGGVAVAVNGRVVPRSAWDETVLRAGDEVEIVQAVQGG